MKKSSVTSLYLVVLKNYKINVIFFILCPMIWSALEMIAPYVIKIIIDQIHQDRSIGFSYFLKLFSLYFLLLLLIEIAIRVCAFSWVSCMPLAKNLMRKTLAQTIFRQPLSYFGSKKNSEVISCLKNIIQSYESIFGQLIFSIIPTFSTAIVLMILLWSLHIMYVVFFLGWFFLMNVIALLMSQRLFFLSKRFAKYENSFWGTFGDMLKNIIPLKLAKKEKTNLPILLEDLSNAEMQAQKKVEWSSFYADCFRSLASLGMFLSFTYLMYRGFSQNKVSIGDLSFLTAASFYTRRSAWTASLSLFDILKNYSKAQESYEYLHLHQKIYEKKPLPHAASLDIEIKNLTFYYKQHQPIYKNFNRVISHGEKVYLSGPSGAGKTTLVRLILGFFKPIRGHVHIGGKDSYSYDLSQAVGYISQQMPLFHASIADNVSWGVGMHSQKELFTALEKTYCADFLKSLPKGLDTLIGEGGDGLSGGQNQRLHLARAWLQNAPILILDEATSALEVELEREILKNFIAKKKKQTLIYISHSEGNRDLFDREIDLNSFRIHLALT